jgi:uncharacterized protein (DUF1015 family)
MVALAPFRALRYSPDVAGDFGRVIAPPYDVISPEQQDQLYAASPFNVVRVILAKEESGVDRYARAKDTFEGWRRQRVLVRDEAPSLYVCEHSFHWDGHTRRRMGVLGLLQFDGSLPDGVLRHEATFEGPKTDRTKLLDAVRAHLSPVFCVVPDAQGQLEEWMRLACQVPPVASAAVPFRTAGGGNGAAEAVRIWKISDPQRLAQAQRIFGPAKALIADGHHRFGAALARRALCPAVLTYFSRAEDPGMIVRPYHRILGRGGASPAVLEPIFRLEPVADLTALQAQLAQRTGPGWFGLSNGRVHQLAQVRPERLAAWLAKPAVPPILAELDVSILHHLVLPALQAAEPALAQVRYTPDAAVAVQTAASGQADWAVLTRAIPLAQIFAIASAGQVLPQKSTYFYPKVLSGLLFHAFDA